MTTDIQAILERNIRVEADKAWETSRTRKLLIASLTYAVVSLYMKFGLGIESAFLHALVPTFGYLLSTLSLSFAKGMWIKKYRP